MMNTPLHRNWISRMRWAAASAVLLLAVITIQPAQAQIFSTIASFLDTNGSSPYYGSLVQATDGYLYGTTSAGGDNGEGVVFRISEGGAITKLYNLCSQSNCTDGSFPYAGLIQATDGNLYGTTYSGGANNLGTVFKITLDGIFTTLYSFAGVADSSGPIGPLVQGTDGNLYGTTYGIANHDPGIVFKITLSGTLTTVYGFAPGDEGHPYAGLIQGTDGNFYGTNVGSGTDHGTVFKITPAGAFTTLYFFCSQVNCTDGSYPYAGLVQASDGNLYGTTGYGGADVTCAGGYGCGTVFKITTTGELTTLYSFSCSSTCPGGYQPYSGLIQATDGNLYGTTTSGGTGLNGGEGTVFEITPSGTLSTLYSFCQGADTCPDGAEPYAGLIQDTNGIFYGTTYWGGNGFQNNLGPFGAVFSEYLGLGPFVKTLPTSGKVGSAVQILGTNLTGATSVSFNGTAATFTVASASLITTTVPTGTTSGPVTVITPSGTLTSNLPFTIPAGGTTTTTLISSLNPSTFNQSVTFTATVTAADGGTPTGTVTFTADGSNVLGASALNGSGQAAVSISALTAGIHSIIASYGGDNNYQPGTSTALMQTVQMASSTLSIASNLDPSVYGQAVTFTIHVTPQFGGSATGGVTFYNSTTMIGTAGVSGNKATLTYSALTVGTAGIQATYSGDSNVAGSTSPVLFQIVTKASTTTAVTSSMNPAFVGQTITFTATVTSQHLGTLSGSVDFKSGTLSLGSATLVNGRASIDASFIASGNHSITAKYLGDVNNTGSTSPTLKQVVNKYPSSTTIASSLNPSTVGQEVTFTATVTVTTNLSPTGTVTFKSGTTVLGTVPLTGNVASLSTSALTAGTHSIKAVYSGDGTFKGSTSPTLKQVVNKYTSSTAVVSSLNPSTVGQEVTFTATVTTSGSPTGTVTFKYGTTVLGTVSLAGNAASLSTSSLAAGSYNINAIYSGDGTFKGSASPVLKQVVN